MQYTLTEAGTPADFEAIAALAKRVWHLTYDSLIGAKQVDYMTEMFQSAEVLARDVRAHGYRYLMAKDGDRLLGYCGVKPEENGSVFLSKVYVDPDFHRQGIGKAMVLHFADLYRDAGYTRMHLTVNKGNSNAICAYQKLGFYPSGELLTDIGNGFVMDDKTMVLDL